MQVQYFVQSDYHFHYKYKKIAPHELKQFLDKTIARISFDIKVFLTLFKAHSKCNPIY